MIDLNKPCGGERRAPIFGGLKAIDGRPYVRPCEAIAPEALADSDNFQSLSGRFGALTRDLPLAGASALAEDAQGDIRLIARLRAAAPWLELAINTIEGYLLVPWATSRASSMNAVAVFIGVLAWGWLWGVWGLLLGIPILMAVKAVCDRVDHLKPIGELLGT